MKIGTPRRTVAVSLAEARKQRELDNAQPLRRQIEKTYNQLLIIIEDYRSETRDIRSLIATQEEWIEAGKVRATGDIALCDAAGKLFDMLRSTARKPTR